MPTRSRANGALLSFDQNISFAGFEGRLSCRESPGGFPRAHGPCCLAWSGIGRVRRLRNLGAIPYVAMLTRGGAREASQLLRLLLTCLRGRTGHDHRPRGSSHAGVPGPQMARISAPLGPGRWSHLDASSPNLSSSRTPQSAKKLAGDPRAWTNRPVRAATVLAVSTPIPGDPRYDQRVSTDVPDSLRALPCRVIGNRGEQPAPRPTTTSPHAHLATAHRGLPRPIPRQEGRGQRRVSSRSRAGPGRRATALHPTILHWRFCCADHDTWAAAVAAPPCPAHHHRDPARAGPGLPGIGQPPRAAPSTPATATWC
jgi:hypothetical protein